MISHGVNEGRIGLVSQFLKVLPRRTASQIVEHTLIEAYGASAEHPEAASEMLRHVGLPEKLWKLPPNTFSGGERQLVNLARALAVRPRLLLLDEPTASLDPAATERLLSLIERLKSEGLAIVAVFHDPEIVRRLAGQTVELTGGLNSPLPHGLTP
ncbi:MAG: ATP-binding cassette domain-containing protein [Planctomycetota bacterium]